jgi:hypothetical protein
VTVRLQWNGSREAQRIADAEYARSLRTRRNKRKSPAKKRRSRKHNENNEEPIDELTQEFFAIARSF